MTGKMKRREFITLLAGAAAWPLAARAQQPERMPVVGYLDFYAAEPTGLFLAAFRKGLSEAGYVERRNVTVEYRYANSDKERLPDLVADLIRRRVAVIDAGRSASAPYTVWLLAAEGHHSTARWGSSVPLSSRPAAFSLAKELRPSHSCMRRASTLSPISWMAPASISRCSVECPIQTAVMLRSELRTCRSTSYPGSTPQRSTVPSSITSHQYRRPLSTSG